MIAYDIKNRILRGRMQRNSVLPSANDISQKYKCSMTTANSALNLLEEESVITRVKGSGNFVNIGPKGKKILRIGLADDLIKTSNVMRKALIDIFPLSAYSYLNKHGCNCSIVPYFVFENRDSGFLANLDGILLSTTFIDDVSLDFICSLEIPIVIYHSEFEHDLPFSQAVPDWKSATKELFKRARRSQIKKIVVCHPSHPNGMFRMECLRKEALLNGFAEEQIQTIGVSTNHTDFLFPKKNIDFKNALVISCSAMDAENILDELRKEGYACGKNYQFACMDDMPKHFLKDATYPSITCLDYSRRDAGRAAAKCLISAAMNKDFKSYQIIRLQTQLILRESAFYNQEGNKIK